jgi:alpha-L-rhamnosidase
MSSGAPERDESIGRGTLLAAEREPFMIWMDEAASREPDAHVAFRGEFEVASDGVVELHTLGSSGYVTWLDGEFLLDGPPRYPPSHPEYQVDRVQLRRGKHTLAVHAMHIGHVTQRHSDIAPFWFCRILAEGEEVPIRWRGRVLPGYTRCVEKIGHGHPWIEWLDTREQPADWWRADATEAGWEEVIQVDPGIGPLQPMDAAGCRYPRVEPRMMASGPLAQRFAWGPEEVAMQFALRDLKCDELPVDGFWRRYDLGRVRLGRPVFTLDLPRGTIVEFGCNDLLYDGRVVPVMAYRGKGQHSALMDHYVARGGEQTFMPLVPKGGRYLEMHVLGVREADARVLEEGYQERTYYDPPAGSFESDDPRLNEIWSVGVETLRGCSEDAVNDCPTRERGQYTGDAMGAGMPIAAAAYSDLRLFRRALRQATQCARDDGMVAGLFPAQPIFTQTFGTYAMQWVTGVLDYFRLSGDRPLLDELYAPAMANLDAFHAFWTPDGLVNHEVDGRTLGWCFIDWGYEPVSEPSDMATNLRYLEALRGGLAWMKIRGDETESSRFLERKADVERVVTAWIESHRHAGTIDFEAVGYQPLVLAMQTDLLPHRDKAAAVEALKNHLRQGFPNDPAAPRAANDQVRSRRIITPYFTNFTFPTLIECGETDFVLEQMRSCWGWMLDGGYTTWLEVFDSRWSHCHAWSGSPTWILSEYALGLRRRFDRGHGEYDLSLRPGSLEKGRGVVPSHMDAPPVRVEWRRQPDGSIEYGIETEGPIRVRLDNDDTRKVSGNCTLILDPEA